MINRKSFLAGTFKKRNRKNKKEPLVENFLKSDPKHGFEVKEIRKKVNRCGSVVCSDLRKLIKQGKVLKNKPFYMWK